MTFDVNELINQVVKVHFKEQGAKIPKVAPCGEVDGTNPDTWLIYSWDVDSVTCPECKKIAEEVDNV